ncbi:MAG: flippase-like domain-containing protein [Chloroflexaceae bacterium]|nr:flippase-like domain-containing protein [Chloroflexaceae bacterium]NJO08089.1 flippase-like domain-containing protein [Chloroflexaceae bacterium]
MSFKQLQSKLLISLASGLVVVIVLSLLSDVQAVGTSLSNFQWMILPLVLGFTVLNYALRWLKWEYYLRRLKLGQGVSTADSALLFTAGLVMSVTPGKIGEVFKAYLLRRINGTPVTASAPIVLVERLTDGFAMLFLMALGLTLYPPAWLFFIVLVVVSVAGIVVLQYRPLCERVLAWISTSLPFGEKVGPKLVTIYASTTQLLDWRVLLVSTLISIVSWGFECLAFYYVLTGLGVEGTLLLLQQATFIFAASTLFGLVSFLPGGLGTSEASSAGLLIVLVGVTGSVATAATIIIRFCTLWFGVLLGMVGLTLFMQRYRTGESVSVSSETLPGTGEQI